MASLRWDYCSEFLLKFFLQVINVVFGDILYDNHAFTLEYLIGPLQFVTSKIESGKHLINVQAVQAWTVSRTINRATESSIPCTNFRCLFKESRRRCGCSHTWQANPMEMWTDIKWLRPFDRVDCKFLGS